MLQMIIEHKELSYFFISFFSLENNFGDETASHNNIVLKMV